jgi:hypothetical protein|tara:strand:+ start:803 stop:976 length:174 start_codon:yes stop_codon:yes gene_type:complete
MEEDKINEIQTIAIKLCRGFQQCGAVENYPKYQDEIYPELTRLLEIIKELKEENDNE